MKTLFLKTVTREALMFVGVVLCVLASCSEEEFNRSFVTEFSLQSLSDGAVYTITVGKPSDYNSSGEKYSVIYVLDGDENMDFVANKCSEISRRQSKQNVLVVGIGYGNDRSLDYTPTKVSGSTGGGPEFLNFIEKQLIPKIEQDFNVDTTRMSRVILGHSYGGLFGAFALTVRNQLFGNYILLSPSLWFDNEVSLVLEKEGRMHNKDQHQLVFLGIGEMENSGRMQAPFDAFIKILSENYVNTLLSTNREKNLDHVGSKNANIEKGLNYYFKKQ